MFDLTLDQALPVVRDLAARKANAFVRRCGLGVDEREDVESQLVLAFLIRWPKFDRAKATVRTFASRVMEKELASILRYRLAEGRRRQELPARQSGPDTVTLRQFRLDMERAVAPLPAAVRRTVAALSGCSAVEAAAALGCSRQMINKRKQLIRRAFLSAGIGPRYFVAGGTR